LTNRLFKIAAALLLGTSLSACISPMARKDGTYTTPIGGAPVIDNETPYSQALRCMGQTLRSNGVRPPRIAVGNIADYTGKFEADGSGRKLTQGAALMAMSALSKAGVRLVERFDTSVAELELKYANNKLIGDKPGAQAEGDFRRIFAGSIPGSDFYLIGGITELNFNIRSASADMFLGSTNISGLRGAIGLKLFVMNVGLDLRLINTQTLEVVKVISYQKQILGREIQPGLFDFLGSTILDIGAGERALEPVQLAVRAVTERAVLEILKDMHGSSAHACANNLGTAKDPLAERSGAAYYEPPRGLQAPQTVQHVQPTPPPAPVPARAAVRYSAPVKEPQDAPRKDPYRR
jgi:curli production assembly/transport component CsgG/holdfast attachment protein HfaB